MGVPGHGTGRENGGASSARSSPAGFILFGRNIKTARATAQADRRSARRGEARARRHHRPGRRPRLAPEGMRRGAAEREAAAREGRPAPDRAARRADRRNPAALRVQPQPRAGARCFLRRRSRQFAEEPDLGPRRRTTVIAQRRRLQPHHARAGRAQLRQTFSRLLARRGRSASRTAGRGAHAPRAGGATSGKRSARSRPKSTR